MRNSIDKAVNVDLVLEETLKRRRWAIYACGVQIPVAVAAMALYFVRRVATVLIVNPVLLFAGCVGLFGAANMDKLFALAHVVLSLGTAALLITLGVVEYVRDTDDWIRLVIHIPILIDVGCGLYSLRFYRAMKHDPQFADSPPEPQPPSESVLNTFRQQYLPSVDTNALSLRQRLWVGQYVAATPYHNPVQVQVHSASNESSAAVSSATAGGPVKPQTYAEPVSSDASSSSSSEASSSSSSLAADAESSFA